MDRVILHHPRHRGHALQEKRDQGRTVFRRQFPVDAFKAPGVFRAVVGRDAHSREHDSRIARTRRLDHLGKVGAQGGQGQSPQAVVSAQLQYDYPRIVLFHGRSQTRQCSGGRVPADAGVDHAEGVARSRQALLQQGYPVLGIGQSITGTQAVSKHENRRRRRRHLVFHKHRLLCCGGCQQCESEKSANKAKNDFPGTH